MLEAFVHIPIVGKIVIVSLLFAIITATAFVTERLRFWSKVSQQHPKFARVLVELYREQPELVEDKIKRNIDLPIARIFAAALKLNNPTPETFRLAMESELQAEVPAMKRFNSFLEALVGLAPLLGLIGTISGLITSFGSLNIGDIGGTKTAGVSAGISEALFTTAAGLIVAAFALIFASLFRALYQRQIALIQEHGGQLELIYRQRYEQATDQTFAIQQLSTAIQQLVATDGTTHQHHS